jgi:hypothetical protein
MQVLKKYWPTILAAVGGLVAFLVPSLTAYAAAYPKTTVGILCACIIAAYHSQAPKDQQ